MKLHKAILADTCTFKRMSSVSIKREPVSGNDKLPLNEMREL